jgi:hypothetical protein
MSSAYVQELNRQMIASQSPQAQPLSLRDRFLNWYRGLPEFTRDRKFSMSEIEVALKAQGKHISPVLLELGWRRKRMWSTTGQYHRYWQPPQLSE